VERCSYEHDCGSPTSDKGRDQITDEQALYDYHSCKTNDDDDDYCHHHHHYNDTFVQCLYMIFISFMVYSCEGNIYTGLKVLNEF
jgi:hypothetical protein